MAISAVSRAATGLGATPRWMELAEPTARLDDEASGVQPFHNSPLGKRLERNGPPVCCQGEQHPGPSFQPGTAKCASAIGITSNIVPPFRIVPVERSFSRLG